MKKILTFSLLVLGMLTAAAAYAQTQSVCDSVYTSAEKMPEYENGIKGISKYTSELTPILAQCMKSGDEMITSLYFTLTIDKQGNVRDVSFQRPALSAACQKALRAKLLTMKGWKPAYLHGKPVCCTYPLSVPCILWQKQ